MSLSLYELLNNLVDLVEVFTLSPEDTENIQIVVYNDTRAEVYSIKEVYLGYDLDASRHLNFVVSHADSLQFVGPSIDVAPEFNRIGVTSSSSRPNRERLLGEINRLFKILQKDLKPNENIVMELENGKYHKLSVDDESDKDNDFLGFEYGSIRLVPNEADPDEGW